jgi:enoyl-CoA hydratase
MSNAITVETRNETAIIRFTRPELRNPLSVGVMLSLDSILDSLTSDPSIREIIFTGSGDVFASGADIREIALLNPQDARGFALRGQRIMQKIADLQPITIAAVNGYCYGGALDLAIACDKRIASPNAMFCHPGAGLGIITAWGGTQRLPRLIGLANASSMFFTAAPINVEEALRIGLIDEIKKDLPV